MSQTSFFKIPRISDRVLIAAFRDLSQQYSLSETGATVFGEIRLENLPQESGITDSWDLLWELDCALVQSFNGRVDGGLQIIFYRGGRADPRSSVFDEIGVTYYPQQGTVTETRRMEVIAWLQNRLRVVEPERGSGVVSDQDLAQAAIHQATLDRLEQLNETLLRTTAEYRDELDRKYDEKILACEAHFADKQVALEADLVSAKAQLQAKEQDLTERMRKIDDRNNTHVRREIRDKMLSDVKARISQFGVSEATQQKRIPVYRAMLALMAALGLMLVFTGFELWRSYTVLADQAEVMRSVSLSVPETARALGIEPTAVGTYLSKLGDSNAHYWLWARLGLVTFGLVCAAIYYIKWQNTWADQHITSEFQLQQFYLDINRASWVVESCLEWRKETESAIPKELLQSISGGLFEGNGDEMAKVLHPADELASALLGTASNLKLKVGNNEINFDKPGAIARKRVRTGGAA